jgi:hypothetical protein
MDIQLRRPLARLVLALSIILALAGCSGDDKELNRQIQSQITELEKQVVGMEEHQQAMREMVREMQNQLNLIQQELNKEAPRIHAVNNHLGYLKQLTTIGFGESSMESTLREPAWTWTSVLWLLFFVLILWLLYRYRIRSTAKR